MNYGKVLAYTQVVLSIFASVGYALARDDRRALYWLFAAGIALCVTWDG
jgi:hypothetical protein